MVFLFDFLIVSGQMTPGRKKYYLPAIAWAIMIAIVSSIPNLSTPRIGLTMTDKVAHFIEYFILGLLTSRALRAFVKKPMSNFWISSALAACYGILDELHQLIIPGRSTEATDMVADILGALLASAIYVQSIQRQRISRS